MRRSDLPARHRTRLAAFAVALPAVLALAACGDPAATGGTAGVSPDGGATDGGTPDTVVAVDVRSGFGPVTEVVTEAPVLVVLADGTSYRPGVVAAIYPGPALPVLESTTLPADDVAHIGALVEAEADLFDDPDLGEPPVADAPTTRVTAALAGQLGSVEAYALGVQGGIGGGIGGGIEGGIEGGGSSVTDDQAAARQDLERLIADVRAVVEGPDREWALVDAPALVVRAVRPDLVDPQIDPGPVRDFPLEAPGLGGEDGTGCVEVRGEDLAAVLAAASDATQITPWRVAGRTVQLAFAPLYPYQDGCA